MTTPLPTDSGNNTPNEDVHPALHNDVNRRVNAHEFRLNEVEEETANNAADTGSLRTTVQSNQAEQEQLRTTVEEDRVALTDALGEQIDVLEDVRDRPDFPVPADQMTDLINSFRKMIHLLGFARTGNDQIRAVIDGNVAVVGGSVVTTTQWGNNDGYPLYYGRGAAASMDGREQQKSAQRMVALQARQTRWTF